MEVLTIAVIRVVGSLPVLRWAFIGGLLAVFVDLSDLFWMNLLDLGGIGNYQHFDKLIDQVYLGTFFIVVYKWSGPRRTIGIVLFLFRLLGFLLFELTDDRFILLFFPNVFEFWFLFVASLPHWKKKFIFQRSNTTLWLAFLSSLKVFQEYVLHQAKWLDNFTAIEAIEAIKNWLISPLQ